jgi:prepilin peptidase CpaA
LAYGLGLLLGVALNIVLLRTAGIWLSLEGMGLALVICLPLYLLRGMGAGDGKLMAAFGAMTGPRHGSEFSFSRRSSEELRP